MSHFVEQKGGTVKLHEPVDERVAAKGAVGGRQARLGRLVRDPLQRGGALVQQGWRVGGERGAG